MGLNYVAHIKKNTLSILFSLAITTKSYQVAQLVEYLIEILE